MFHEILIVHAKKDFFGPVKNIVIYWVDSAVWSNSAVWFGHLVNEIRPSGFYLFGCPDSAVWAIPEFFYNSLLWGVEGDQD